MQRGCCRSQQYCRRYSTVLLLLLWLCVQVVMQLLQRLLEHEKGALEGRWGELVSEVIAAIDGEKDPRCLLLSFRIVELLVQAREP